MAKKTAEQKIENAKQALEALRQRIGECAWQDNPVSVSKLYNGKNCVSYEIRDWGTWVNPYDSDGEQDYDWKILDEGSKARLKEIVQTYNTLYNVDIHFTCEEKNWITFTITID